MNDEDLRMARPTATDEAAGAPARAMPGDDAVLEALRVVEDPEAGMNIVDLGLVYAVDVRPDAVDVSITMTTAACPMTDMIVEDVRNTIAAMTPGGTEIRIEVVWDPPWTPDRMSGIAREHFGRTI
jgi:metal-sulfur cluster biosynthetic enzyme